MLVQAASQVQVHWQNPQGSMQTHRRGLKRGWGTRQGALKGRKQEEKMQGVRLQSLEFAVMQKKMKGMVCCMTEG